MREHDLMQQARGALVAHGEALAASCVTQGAGHVGLSCTGRTENEDVEMTADPLTLSQFENEAAIKAASRGEVEIFDHSGERKASSFNAEAQAVIRPAGALQIDQQAEPILE